MACVTRILLATEHKTKKQKIQKRFIVTHKKKQSSNGKMIEITNGIYFAHTANDVASDKFLSIGCVFAIDARE